MLNFLGVTQGLIIAVLALFPVRAGAEQSISELKSFFPDTKEDYGSGASIRTEWYSPGGLGSGGVVFVGHPNNLARSDRALVRFNLDSLLIKPAAWISHRKAKLRFKVSSFTGRLNVRKIEVAYLTYDPWSFTGNDLVNRNAQVVGTVSVVRKNYSKRTYSVDVTNEVRNGLLRGIKYFGFRFRDVEAEANGNSSLSPLGIGLMFQDEKPVLEIVDDGQ